MQKNNRNFEKRISRKKETDFLFSLTHETWFSNSKRSPHLPVQRLNFKVEFQLETSQTAFWTHKRLPLSLKVFNWKSFNWRPFECKSLVKVLLVERPKLPSVHASDDKYVFYFLKINSVSWRGRETYEYHNLPNLANFWTCLILKFAILKHF